MWNMYRMTIYPNFGGGGGYYLYVCSIHEMADTLTVVHFCRNAAKHTFAHSVHGSANSKVLLFSAVRNKGHTLVCP
jgi:hypothetical protein